MSNSLGKRSVLLNVLVIHGVLLWFSLHMVSCRVISCQPHDGSTGGMTSVILRVRRFVNESVNFRRDSPRPLSKPFYHTIPNDGKIHLFNSNLKVKFHGKDVCVSTMKETVVDEKGANENKKYSCERVCFGLGDRVNLVTNSSSGGRLWHGKMCCVRKREIYLQLDVMTAGPKCLTCQRRMCQRDHMTIKQCPPGDKCLAITLNKPESAAETNSSVLPLMLGCSSDDGLRGYSCNDQCRREVKLVGSGVRRVCVRCCTGNECNRVGASKNETETTVMEDGVQDRKLSETVNGGSGDKGDKLLITFGLTAVHCGLSWSKMKW